MIIYIFRIDIVSSIWRETTGSSIGGTEQRKISLNQDKGVKFINMSSNISVIGIFHDLAILIFSLSHRHLSKYVSMYWTKLLLLNNNWKYHDNYSLNENEVIRYLKYLWGR